MKQKPVVSIMHARKQSSRRATLINDTGTQRALCQVQSTALPLTARQLEIARYLVVGKTAREIAAQLTLSRRTVESHIDALKLRLDCINRCELTAKLVRLGIELDE